MENIFSPVGVFAAASLSSGTAGIAAYLRSGKPVSWLAIITAGLNSGLLGLAISLLWYRQFADNIYSLLGICVVTGLTGAAGLDLLLTIIAKGGLTVNIGGKENKLGFDFDSDKPKKVTDE